MCIILVQVRQFVSTSVLLFCVIQFKLLKTVTTNIHFIRETAWLDCRNLMMTLSVVHSSSGCFPFESQFNYILNHIMLNKLS